MHPVLSLADLPMVQSLSQKNSKQLRIYWDNKSKNAKAVDWGFLYFQVNQHLSEKESIAAKIEMKRDKSRPS